MPDTFILPDDEPPSMPSLPTQWGGDPAALGRIDHYDLLRKLGGGGFGVVYLARDSVSGVEVALKTLHPLLKRNAEEMDLLREKFRLVHGLTHPNIAKALVIHLVREINVWDDAARAELKLSPGDSVMVMDYAPGVTLSRWRRQFPGGIVPPDLALEVGRQVAAALDYAHSERIVHRDVKPGNIMVETVAAGPQALDQEGEAAPCAASGRQDDEETRRHDSASGTFGGRGSITRRPVVSSSRRPSRLRVRILDFGLAAEIRSSMSRVSTDTGDTSGTRPYMAPEQWLGKKQDGRTDQYALACVLYELLSGAPPFAGVFETGDPAVMKSAVVGDTPEEIEGLSAVANAALLRALAKSPGDRFPSCTALVEAFSSTAERLEDTEGGAIRPGGPQGQAALEADVLRRKVALSRALADISAEDLAHALFGPPAKEAETELAATEEAFKWNRFAAAAACLDRAEAALARLEQVRREEAERIRREKEEAERRVREKAERERKEREEAERLAREKAERERKEREEAERLAREKAERERKEREEAERLAREKAEREKAELIRREAEERARREREQQEKTAIAAWERQREKRIRGKRLRRAGLIALALGVSLAVSHIVAAWMRRDAGIRNLTPDESIPEVEGRCAYCFAHREMLPKGENPFHFAKDCPHRDKWDTQDAAGRNESRKAGERKVVSVGGGVSLEMVACPGVATDFWMGKYEVTQEQWECVMGSNRSYFKGAKNPVESVSWNDCQEFVKKLNALPAAKASGLTFRLPTEEEWETACRAGAPKSEDYCKLADGTQITKANLSRVAWFEANSGVMTHPVGLKDPNAWGLYDMHGNVWEWTQTAVGGNRVNRGGSCDLLAGYCSAGFRGRLAPGDRNWYLGFRLAASGRTAAK